MAGVRNIGSRLELFVDDWLIDTMTDTSLKLHPPVPAEVVLDFDQPWEGETSWAANVTLDDGRYRLWYRATGPDGTNRTTCYAESPDGIHFERPTLGLHEFGGSKENNIVMGAVHWNACVFKDPNPAAPGSQRYKGFLRGEKLDGRSTIYGYGSPDGIHWELIRDGPILHAPPDDRPVFDSPNVAFWDVNIRKYVAYLRGFTPDCDRVTGPARGGVYRSIRRAESDDFLDWTVPELIDMGGRQTEHLYTNAATLYFRAPHNYMMFPKRLRLGRKFHKEWPFDGLSEGVFMTSRDGIQWDRRFMGPFIRPGLDSRNWNERNMAAGVGVVPTGPGEISIYYVENYRNPTCRLRRGVLRTDGFVSVNAPFCGGEMVTRPFTFAGSELVINYSTSVAGEIRFEMQDEQGRPIAGRTLSESAGIFGDEIARTVRWDNGPDVSALAGRPVRLRAAMREADLYAIRFR